MIPTRILIADDHAVVREGLKVILQREEDFSVVAEARSGEEAVEKAVNFEPDVVVMDVRMPNDISGIEACKRILRKLPNTRVVMLTAYPDDELAMDAVRAGAVGYVVKRVDSSELIEDIRNISKGDAVVDPAAPCILLHELPEATDHRKTSIFGDLTERQLQVLTLITQGLTNREIAHELFLSEGTVRNYVGTILRILYVSNRAAAAVCAVKHHIEQYV